MSNFDTIPLTTIDGSVVTLKNFSGQVLLIVNVASKCGLTPQYTALEQVYQKYKDRGLVVLGFPSNDFAGQEPGTNEDIAKFCSTVYPVSFPIFSKVIVTGESKHPLFQALIETAPEHLIHGPWRENLEKYAAANNFPPPNPLPELLWNFEKFLIGRDGEVVARFAPDTPPDDPVLITLLEQSLAQQT